MASLEQLASRLNSARYTRKTLADGSGVVLDVQGMRVLSLNLTGAFLVDEIAAGAANARALSERLVEVFEVDPRTAAVDVAELLDDLGRVLAEEGPS